MTYKQAITYAMTDLAADPAVCFIGYGITHGKAMGTLANVNPAQLIETPVAENLMVGLATGLSLRGRKPVVFIERCDFLLNALDAIVNHLIKIKLMSRGEFAPAVMLRVVVGNKEKPLFTGETHTQDFSRAFEMLVNPEELHPWVMNWPIKRPEDARGFNRFGHPRFENGASTVFWEYKDLY